MESSLVIKKNIDICFINMCNNDSCGHFVLKLTAQHISLQNKISK